jgi:hypothetical protein
MNLKNKAISFFLGLLKNNGKSDFQDNILAIQIKRFKKAKIISFFVSNLDAQYHCQK